jgi:hypothetical protein
MALGRDEQDVKVVMVVIEKGDAASERLEDVSCNLAQWVSS